MLERLDDLLVAGGGGEVLPQLVEREQQLLHARACALALQVVRAGELRDKGVEGAGPKAHALGLPQRLSFRVRERRDLCLREREARLAQRLARGAAQSAATASQCLQDSQICHASALLKNADKAYYMETRSKTRLHFQPLMGGCAVYWCC